jgi:hypothetical protein
VIPASAQIVAGAGFFLVIFGHAWIGSGSIRTLALPGRCASNIC